MGVDALIGLTVWVVSWMFVFYVIAQSGTVTWDDILNKPDRGKAKK